MKPLSVSGSAKAHVFVQARMGSTRLPGKMLAELNGKPVLEWVLRRVKMAAMVSDVFLLTSSHKENEKLLDICRAIGINTYVGDENNVVSRFVEAACKWPADHYVRVCADNPYICPGEIDRLIQFHCKGGYDYSFNHIPALDNQYVDGFGAEIFRADLMQKLRDDTLTLDEKEHVTRYFWSRRSSFKFGVLPAPESLRHPDLSFDIDTESDLLKFKSIADLITIEMTAEDILHKLDKSGDLATFKVQH